MRLWHQSTDTSLGSSLRHEQEEAAPLLLIHGMGSASTAWKLITPALSEELTVIAIDLPGHGNTPLPKDQAMDPHSLALLVKAELDELGVTRVHVAGNSLGGWIALELAAQIPHLVASVIALAPAGLWLKPSHRRQKRGDFARYLATSTHRIAPYLMQYQWARRIGFGVVSPLWRELPLETCIDAAIAYGTSDGYYPAWDGMLGRRFDKEIPPSLPVAVVFGEHDNTLPAKHSQERSLLPTHCEWIRIPQAGHAPMWDHPDLVVQIILRTVNLA